MKKLDRIFLLIVNDEQFLTLEEGTIAALKKGKIWFPAKLVSWARSKNVPIGAFRKESHIYPKTTAPGKDTYVLIRTL